MTDNPAAFPSNIVYPPQGGMTLRDWFAGQAFAACFTNASGFGDLSEDEKAAQYAELAVEMYAAADAMLARRASLSRQNEEKANG